MAVSPLATDSFALRIAQEGQSLRRSHLDILQINVGRLCNQTCSHCHVNAGPYRTEVMTRETTDRVLEWLADTDISTVDITGGAPEMVPSFEHLVQQCRSLGRHVIDRCNLTVIFEPGKEHLPEFLAEHGIELACSLPCYLEENVDKQRGSGVFRTSIEALRRFNEIGYGRPGSGLVLDLIYNPVGVSLPPRQDQLEADYKRELEVHYGVVFNRLWTITNMPISRFGTYLRQTGQAADYQRRLEEAHNPDNVAKVMCRTILSVDYQGWIYDCDFNQMLDWPIRNGQALRLWDLDPDQLAKIPIQTGAHCFGCTAGAGSSCGGALG